MIIIEKPDRNFTKKCNKLQSNITKRSDNLQTESSENLQFIIEKYLNTPVGEVANTEELLVEILPALCVLCERKEGNSQKFSTNSEAILGAIIASQRILLNYNFTIPNLNFIVLSTILVNFAQNKTIHIYCREFSAAKYLYHDLERMLGVFGIKSHLIGNDSDAKIIEYYYQNVPVLFGSCEGFNGDSLFAEDVSRRLTLRRDTVFFTDVNLVPDFSQNYYNQFANYEDNKYISGISSSFTLAAKYENVLGIGLGNYISKEILKYSFPQNLSIHDCAVLSLKIHVVKGNFISLRTIAKLAQNYNIDYNKFCGKYEEIMQECTVFANTQAISTMLEKCRMEVLAYFENNPNERTKGIKLYIKGTPIEIKLLRKAVETSTDFVEVVVKHIVLFSSYLAWDEYVNAVFTIHEHYVAKANGEVPTATNAEINKLLFEFGKAASRTNKYAMESLESGVK